MTDEVWDDFERTRREEITISLTALEVCTIIACLPFRESEAAYRIGEKFRAEIANQEARLR